MRKILSSFFFFVALAVGSVAALATGPASQGGYSGPGPAVMSVQDVLTMRDNAPVVMRGHIVQHLGKDKYLFRDASGTIRVDIGSDRWPTQAINPNNLIELHGDVDKDWNSVEVEVKRVVKLQ